MPNDDKTGYVDVNQDFKKVNTYSVNKKPFY
jgi:hypothetical protein